MRAAHSASHFFPRSVDITYESSRLEPRQLQAIFEATLPLLLEIFNPQGWCAEPHRCVRRAFGTAKDTPDTSDTAEFNRRLELTYVDEALRVGRDDKGHTFVLERAARSDAADAVLAES